MLNAERIFCALDRHLDHVVSLVLYGRTAIALAQVVIPDLVELRDAFERAKLGVRELARRSGYTIGQ